MPSSWPASQSLVPLELTGRSVKSNFGRFWGRQHLRFAWLAVGGLGLEDGTRGDWGGCGGDALGLRLSSTLAPSSPTDVSEGVSSVPELGS